MDKQETRGEMRISVEREPKNDDLGQTALSGDRLGGGCSAYDGLGLVQC